MIKNKASFHLPASGYKGTAQSRDFEWILDEPEDLGGTNQGPTPTETVNAALGGCIAITVRMYAERKNWDTGEINVEIYTSENENKLTQIHKNISFGNPDLTPEQIERLHLIATKCPVSKLLQQATAVILD
ncbi:MAG: OsmC family protein [Flavobacteriaceae bacterium]|nr:OsmC family protein [Flavobacteriaceae bacterium]